MSHLSAFSRNSQALFFNITSSSEDISPPSDSLKSSMLEVEVISKKMEAEAIASFELAALGDQSLPSFEAGAHIDVQIAVGLVRQYSLFNPPGQGQRYCIGVLRDRASRGGSVALFDTIQKGARLKISTPRNHFKLDPSATRSLLFAGGIGITPILGMAQQLDYSGANFHLHYCGRSLGHMAFTDTLLDSRFSAQISLHADNGPEAQRFNASESIGPPDAATHLYVCGPSGYMDHVLETARKLGWPELRLHREYFSGAVVDHAADDPFDVEIKSTGQLVHVGADASVAQALTAAGISLALSCEQGVCGTCITRILEGTPDHRDMYLTDAERIKNDCFMPCCSRSRSTRLVLDL